MNSLHQINRSFLRLLPFFIVLVLASCGSGGQKSSNDATSENRPTSIPGNDAAISFDKSQHEFGPVFSGEKVSYNFRFTNTGDSPLIILNVHSGCGCTIGDYPKEPIPPGGTGRINVMFNSAGRRGMQSESVRVFTNANPQEHLLRITAEVIQN